MDDGINRLIEVADTTAIRGVDGRVTVVTREELTAYLKLRDVVARGGVLRIEGGD